MPKVIVLEHPRYAAVYRNRDARPDHRDDNIDDRRNLDGAEAWARWVDERSDGVATPEYLAERSSSDRRPLAHMGNRVTYCLIPMPRHWQGGAPNYYQAPPPPQGATQPLTAQQWQARSQQRSDLIREHIVDVTLQTFARAARWCRPRGTVSILVGHGGAYFTDVPGVPGYAGVDLAPAHAAGVNTHFLRSLARMVEERREQGQSFHDIALQGWDPASSMVLRMGSMFRHSRVRQVDLLVCQTGVGMAGVTFLNLLSRFWGARVRGMRGSAGYFAGGVWEVDRPIRPPPRFSMRVQSPNFDIADDGALLGTSNPHRRTDPAYMSDADPSGYPPDSMFRSSSNPPSL